MKDPANAYEFDEICYDSDDADFQHEYEDLEAEELENSQHDDYNKCSMEFPQSYTSERQVIGSVPGLISRQSDVSNLRSYYNKEEFN